MYQRITSTIGTVRNPEYTGDNRCLPCTAVNVLIAAVASALAWVLVPVAGFVVAAVSLLSIYLRGYLVPGTPTLTKRYFPDWLLRQFDKEPAPSSAPEGSVDIEQFLLDSGVLVEGPVDLELDDQFETMWYREMERTENAEEDATRLANMLGIEESDIEITYHDDALVARGNGSRIGQWESRAAFVADIAAAAVLEEHSPNWTTLSMADRSELLGVLRLFLERCPECNGEVELGQEVVESCCRSIDVVATTCRECSTRLFESPYDPDAVDGGAAAEANPSGGD